MGAGDLACRPQRTLTSDEVEASHRFQSQTATPGDHANVAFLGEEKQKRLADLAFAAVAGDLCQGLKLDRKTFESDFDNHFGETAYQAKSAADLAQYGQKVSIYFGVYVGMLTAVGIQERESFCGAALDMLAEGEGRYWLAVDAAKPGAQSKP